MRALGKFLVGTLAVIGVLFLALVGLVWWGVSSLDVREAMTDVDMPAAMVLTLDLRRPIPEGEPAAPLGVLGEEPVASLAGMVRAIDAAAVDPAVKGLLAEGGGVRAGLAQVQELRAAVARFRAAGKPALFFAETMAEGDASLETWLAAAFDEVWMQPSGAVGPLGFGAQVPFARGLLEEIGIRPQFDSRENYKTAFDSLTRREMSPAQRESLNALLGGFWAQYKTDMATDRGLSPAAVAQAAEASPLLAPEAVERGVVDRLAYRDAAEQEMFTRAGTRETLELAAYADALLNRTPPEGTPRIALIQASGPVMRGAEEGGPLAGGAAIYSETLTDAIESAVEDGSVRAILLRIDSPGGSYVASDTVWHAIRRARDQGMPVIVSMGSVAASGGYFIAMAGDHVLAAPGTVTGSIGVISGKFVLRDLWQNLNITWEDVTAGGPALMYSPNRAFTPAQYRKFQESLDFIYQDFTQKVALSRGLTEAQVQAVAGGRIWTGAAALENGLIDEIGGVNEAITAAKRRAGIPADQPVALEPFPKPESLFEQLLDLADATPLATGADARALAALARAVVSLEPLTRRLEALDQGPLRAPVP